MNIYAEIHRESEVSDEIIGVAVPPLRNYWAWTGTWGAHIDILPLRVYSHFCAPPCPSPAYGPVI